MDMDEQIALIPIMIDEPTYQEFRKLAKARQRDVADEIALALRKYLERPCEDDIRH